MDKAINKLHKNINAAFGLVYNKERRTVALDNFLIAVTPFMLFPSQNDLRKTSVFFINFLALLNIYLLLRLIIIIN